MTNSSLNQKFLLVFAAAAFLFAGASPARAIEGPPTTNGGVIGDPNLVRNSDIAKAQAVGAITSFMSKGAQECDADGTNCRSLFGADDTPDYTALKFRGQATTGTEAYSFQTENQDTGSIATQMGTLAVACGDTKVKQVAGLAVKLLSCAVQPSGNAKITVQVCTAPERGNPITPPENAVACSNNPKDPNFTAPEGKVCIRPSCDTEPLNSLNGWSSPKNISWDASMGDSASEEERSQNGLGLIFYPNPAAGTQLSFATDSDNMTAVKVIQSFINKDTGATAVGLRVAYRHKTALTKEMLTESGSVPNPGQHTSQWDTLMKLQSNAMIPQLQAKYAANGSECLQQIQEGVASDGVIYVCEQGYNNEAGIRPLAISAQVAAAGQECGSMPQCLQEVVNTNTWTETCQADVPLAMRDCTTTQDFTKDKISYTRTKTTEICHEKRLTAEYSCNTKATTGATETYWAPATDLSAAGSTNAQTVLKFDRVFTTQVNAAPIAARISYIHVDNWADIRLNGRRIWGSYDNNLHQVKTDDWGIPDLVKNCDNDTYEETYYDSDGNQLKMMVTGVRCTMQNGERVRANYSDACTNTHCVTTADHNVDIAIPVEFLRDGNNVIQMACFNNKGPSYCNYQLQVQYMKMTQYVIDNSECARYEAAR
ncbi:hypothetical protein LMG26857_03779 [Achromobacter anxifer]|uniref:hypothetical protein n=1 Tax=Achromobacter anxifer TaxID=1287737 RepID=UPI00155B545B|nr:hypothetical protein [Achromobacter anxifer]CAB5514720.1 hypothetical protein LMG26857_03779 [Achromobacter anxifer]